MLSILMGRTDTTGPAGELLGVDAGPVSLLRSLVHMSNAVNPQTDSVSTLQVLPDADSCALPDVCLQLNGFWTCTAGFYHAACRIQVIAGPLQVIRRIIEGGLAGAASRAGRRPRMIWKTTTSVGLRHMPDEAEMLNIYSPVGLALFDMKALADIGDLGNPWEVSLPAGRSTRTDKQRQCCTVRCLTWQRLSKHTLTHANLHDTILIETSNGQLPPSCAVTSLADRHSALASARHQQWSALHFGR